MRRRARAVKQLDHVLDAILAALAHRSLNTQKTHPTFPSHPAE
jgi:hypothetical protein